MDETNPVLSDPGIARTGVGSRPSESVPGVDRFAHFVVNRREDGELDRLGMGAMGITYRAYDTQLERLVALKTIHPQWVDDPEVRSRFAREARAAARLQHPNIASVLFQGEEASVCFYAMELVAGEDLHHYIKRVGPLSSVHALRMAHQIALALVAASREGIIHRDLKPANVMLTSYHDGAEPHLKVIDFGLAKIAMDSPATFTTGGFMGTPEYASPEQCQERELDSRSDIYSLGGILWFLLTAASPFTGSLLTVIRAQVAAQPAWEKLPGAPMPLLAIVRRLMAKNRELRPGSALEAAQEIERTIEVLSEDPRNFHPLSAASVAPDGAAAPSHSATVFASTIGATPNDTARASGNRWIVPTLISLCCFAGGIYGWKASHAGRAGAQGAPAPQESAALPLIARPAAEPAPPSQPVQPTASATSSPASTASAMAFLQRAERGEKAQSLAPPRLAPADFTNSLGMRFIRPKGSPILASVWETRVGDFAAYAAQSSMLSSIAKDRTQRSWRNPGFAQADDHPVVYVSPPDAVAFCRWLTDKEHRAGVLPADEYYRLPTRLEWDALLTGVTVQSAPAAPESTPSPGVWKVFTPPPLVSTWKPGDPPPTAENWKPGDPPPRGWHPGMPLPIPAMPAMAPQLQPMPAPIPAPTPIPQPRSMAVTPFFWGTFAWPPPPGFANYGAGAYSSGKTSPTAGDGFAFTAPVGSFRPNVDGLMDMSGNASEICVDGPPNSTVYIKQGGSWASVSQNELRMHEATPMQGAQRESTTGFRCVIAKTQ